MNYVDSKKNFIVLSYVQKYNKSVRLTRDLSKNFYRHKKTGAILSEEIIIATEKYIIERVFRTHDGEIFCLGDRVKTKFQNYVIKKFTPHHDLGLQIFDNEEEKDYPNNYLHDFYLEIISDKKQIIESL